jgi:hypothetical protein
LSSTLLLSVCFVGSSARLLTFHCGYGEDRKNERYEAFLSAAPPGLGDDPLAAFRESVALPAQESLPRKRDREALRQSARRPIRSLSDRSAANTPDPNTLVRCCRSALAPSGSATASGVSAGPRGRLLRMRCFAPFLVNVKSVWLSPSGLEVYAGAVLNSVVCSGSSMRVL